MKSRRLWLFAGSFLDESESRFDPPTSGDFPSDSGCGRRRSLVREPASPYEGSESPGNCSGSSFLPRPGSLEQNFWMLGLVVGVKM